MRDVLMLARSDILKLVPYNTPKKNHSEGEVWLNANELPWQPYGPAQRGNTETQETHTENPHTERERHPH